MRAVRIYLALIATIALIAAAAADGIFNGNTAVTLSTVWTAVTGDCTASAGSFTCTKTNGTAFSSLATTTPGTGVTTALGTNVGTAGSVVVNGGPLGTPSSGTATNLTGTASGLTAGNVTTNANLTGPVTSVGNATTIGTNQVSRANLAQGTARSVIGVTGNATANVADIQGTANQVLVTNSGGTAVAFGQVNLASSAAVVNTLPVANGGFDSTAWTTFTPSPSCGTATFTVNSARSKTNGKTTFLQYDVSITAIGTCTNGVGGTPFAMNLPNTAQSGGSFAGRENTATGKTIGCTIVAGGTTINCSPADITNFQVNMRVIVSGVYENQ